LPSDVAAAAAAAGVTLVINVIERRESISEADDDVD